MTKEIYSYEQKINEEFIASLNPCSDRHENYLEHYPEKEFTLEEFILLDKITYSDKKWVIWNNFLSILDKRKLACVFARHVLYIFEAKYPDDKRPRLALECAENENSTKKERIAAAAYAARAADAARAAYAARAAADAAAAYAARAADAAYAARAADAARAAYAARAAADAARAAADAAYAYAADAYAAYAADAYAAYAAYAYAADAYAAYAAYAAADAAYADADARADERQFQLEQMVIVIKERNK